MAIKIRLARGGRKKVARFRIVVADTKSPRDGRFIETLGYYNPQTNPKDFKINTARVGYWWKQQGALVSQTVANLLEQDRFNERWDAICKDIDPETLDIQRKAEPQKKQKKRKKSEN